MVVRARINGEEAPFIFDSGIGVTLLGTVFAERVGVEPSRGEFSGRRMSGQEVSLALGEASSIELGPFLRENVTVGIFDLGGVPPELAELAGFLSLGVFGDSVTVDYARSELSAERVEGVEVPLELHADGPSLDAYMTLELPSGRRVLVEVDMGSDVLILDERFADDVGVDLADDALLRREGMDETGYRYVRTFAAVAGVVQPAGAPELGQRDPQVIFQSIIHDGLVGQDFLSRFAAVTWDLAGARLIFARAGPQPPP